MNLVNSTTPYILNCFSHDMRENMWPPNGLYVDIKLLRMLMRSEVGRNQVTLFWASRNPLKLHSISDLLCHLHSSEY